MMASPQSSLSAATLQGVSLSPVVVSTPEETTFALDLMVDCGANADAASLTLGFNPIYLQVETVTADETVFPNVLRRRFDNAAGSVNYDAGSIMCHSEGNCPSGVIRVATVTFRAVRRTLPSTPVTVRGQVVWAGSTTFDGLGEGSTVTITSTSPVLYGLSLPLVSR
jgi:hypothetical protein